MVYLSVAGLPRLSWKKAVPFNGCSSSSSRLVVTAQDQKDNKDARLNQCECARCVLVNRGLEAEVTCSNPVWSISE